jgi:hypothetical protein
MLLMAISSFSIVIPKGCLLSIRQKVIFGINKCSILQLARMGEKRNAYRLLVGKPEGRRPLGRPRRRWLDNIRMDLVEVGSGDVDWIGLAQDRGRWRALVN